MSFELAERRGADIDVINPLAELCENGLLTVVVDPQTNEDVYVVSRMNLQAHSRNRDFSTNQPANTIRNLSFHYGKNHIRAKEHPEEEIEHCKCPIRTFFPKGYPEGVIDFCSLLKVADQLGALKMMEKQQEIAEEPEEVCSRKEIEDPWEPIKVLRRSLGPRAIELIQTYAEAVEFQVASAYNSSY